MLADAQRAMGRGSRAASGTRRGDRWTWVEVDGLGACFRARFSAAAPLPFGAGSSFAVRAALCVVECLVPSRAFGFYLLDASSPSLQL